MGRRRKVAALLFAASVILVIACGDNPGGTECSEQGSTKYTSKHGNFKCVESPFGGLRWEEM